MHFSKTYREWWNEDVILRIGAKAYTRKACVHELGVPNFQAARHLDVALKALKIKSVKQLHALTPADLFALPKVGERAIFVAMCVIDTTAIGLGGETGDGEKWLHTDEDPLTGRKRRPKGEGNGHG